MSIDLIFDRIEGARPERTIAFLHGILGRGHNLWTIAKRFVESKPEWTAWLVDLRGHGRSPKSTPGPSLEAAALDVVKLAAGATPPLAAIAGHSFGGKLGLEAARIGGIATLEHVFAIDSVPGAREPLRGGDSALGLIDTIESLPATFGSLTEFTERLVATGQTRKLAEWLAGSLEREGNRVRFGLDLREIRALILDYFARNLWPVVEQPPNGTHVHLVIGDRSDSYSASDRERATRIAVSSDHVTVDVLPAGHWVHADDRDGLLRVLVNRVDGARAENQP